MIFHLLLPAMQIAIYCFIDVIKSSHNRLESLIYRINNFGDWIQNKIAINKSSNLEQDKIKYICYNCYKYFENRDDVKNHYGPCYECHHLFPERTLRWVKFSL